MLPIVISPDPILATVCEPCDLGDKSLKRLSKQMAHAMYKNYGCGIAAPQVGVTKRLVVIDVDWDGEKGEKNPIVLVNPEIVELAGEPEEGGEGCLSCPGVTVPVKHEIDHLNGKTLFECCDAATRIEALRAYEEARAAGARPGDTDIEVK